MCQSVCVSVRCDLLFLKREKKNTILQSKFSGVYFANYGDDSVATETRNGQKFKQTVLPDFETIQRMLS